MNALVILRYKSSIIVKDMQSDDGRAHDWIKFFRSFVLSMIGIGCPSYEIGGLERRSFFGAYGTYPERGDVDESGLMSYGVDYDDLFRKAAHYVDRILKGTNPADLPVQQAMKFEFIINLKAAKQIGVTLPFELLARANKVIK